MENRNDWKAITRILKKSTPDDLEYYEIPWEKLKLHLHELQEYPILTTYQQQGKSKVYVSYKKPMEAYEILLLLEQGDNGDSDGFGVEPDHWGVAYLNEDEEFLSDFVSSLDIKRCERQYAKVCLTRRKDYFIGALFGAASASEADPVYQATVMGLAYCDNFDTAYQKGMKVDFEAGRGLVYGVSTLGLFTVIIAGLLSGYRLYDARNIAFKKLVNGSIYRDYMLKSYTSYRAEKKELDENLLLEPLRDIPGDAGSLMVSIYAFFLYGSDYVKALAFINKYRGNDDAASAMGRAILGALGGIQGLPLELKYEDDKIKAITQAAEAYHRAVVSRL